MKTESVDGEGEGEGEENGAQQRKKEGNEGKMAEKGGGILQLRPNYQYIDDAITEKRVWLHSLRPLHSEEFCFREPLLSH